MTKKAKTKTKSDEAPPKTAPGETQSAESSPNPDQRAPTVPATTLPAPQQLAVLQPKDAASAATAATAAVAPAAAPVASTAKSGDSKASEPQTMAAHPTGLPSAIPADAGSLAQKSVPLTQANCSQVESKPPIVPVQNEPAKEQVTSLRPETNSQPSPESSVGDLASTPTSNKKPSEIAEKKSELEKASKPSAPSKTQDVGKDVAEKNVKATPAALKAASNNQPSKKPAEKQNKRQAAKESASSNSVAKGEATVSKPTEVNIKQVSQDEVIEKPESSSKAKTAKDKAVAKVDAVTPTHVKEEPNRTQLPDTAPETHTKQSGESDGSRKTSDSEPSTPKDSSTKNTTVTTGNVTSIEKLEISKGPTTDGKTVEQKVVPGVAAQGNQQKPVLTKSSPIKEVKKDTLTKKNKQKSETSTSKSEVVPNPKDAKQVDKETKKDTAEDTTGAHSSAKLSEAHELLVEPDNLKKLSLSVLPDSVSKFPTLETLASDHLTQVKEHDNKVDQQAKIIQDSNGGKECPLKDDAQSRPDNRKKNRQQKKSASEDVHPSEKSGSKGTQDVGKSKNNEKKKPAAASPSKEKESRNTTPLAPVRKNRKNISDEPGPKDSPQKLSKTEQTSLAPVTTANAQLISAASDSGSKAQVLLDELQAEEQIASKKKKRNRHKKKNKACDGENAAAGENAEGRKQQEAKVASDSGEVRAKDKDQTAVPRSNKSKGQQKDAQQAQSNANKGPRPVLAAMKDGQAAAQASDETLANEISEAIGQTTSSKKRNRRKKKGASEMEKESGANQPQECKPIEARETSDAKPEEQKAKVSTQLLQTRVDETQKKKSDSKPTTILEKPQQQDVESTGSGAIAEGTEDQSEKFVEVKSKNKRNKKKKLDSTEAKEDKATPSTPPNDMSKVVTENTIDRSVGCNKGKMGEENSESDSTKERASKVAAPKISQEAREQKMLNKKLAERAQQKLQKQIESNALSEVEQSEKYLETITKNLKELTKLRSSRLEDVLQKSADGTVADEEFEYEYAPIQRTTFLAKTCHICKELKPRETMRNCEQCHLVSYCSEEHQKSDWLAHKDLCQAISEICKERGTNNLFAPAVGLSAEEYRRYRMNTLLECSAILNRQLEPYEQEMILYPNVCHTCHLSCPAKLQTCEMCSMVSYCSPEHSPPNHDVWCHDLQLYKSLIIYQSRNGVISPQLPVFLSETFQPPSGDMQSHLQTLSGTKAASPLECSVLSEIATGPLTTLFALHKANKVCDATEKLVVHFVGAEWSFELERGDKWEAFLMHLLPNLKALVLVFVGPEVCNLPQEARGLLQKQSRLCPQCHEKGRTLEMVIAPQSFYHEYAASQNYVPPDIICAFNAGLYRPNGYKEVDSWADTMGALLRYPGIPVAVTSYTAEEVLKDAERLQHHRPLNFVLPPSQNPYRSLRPNRNFASDDVTPVIFKNYYIMIATSLPL